MDLDPDQVEQLLTDEPERLDAQYAIQPVIFLRGARVDNSVWDAVQRRLWERGWATTAKRAAAAHLARGGAPVVFLDFSARTVDDLKVAGVRAVFRDEELTLELINGGTVDTPRLADGSIDADRVVQLVQQVIGDLPAINERRMLAAQRAANSR